MKTIAGSLLLGLSLLAQVVSEWASHFFYAFFQMGKGAMLEGGGSFSPPAMYNAPESVGLMTFTQALVWIFMAFGFFLILQGIDDRKKKKD